MSKTVTVQILEACKDGTECIFYINNGALMVGVRNNATGKRLSKAVSPVEMFSRNDMEPDEIIAEMIKEQVAEVRR